MTFKKRIEKSTKSKSAFLENVINNIPVADLPRKTERRHKLCNSKVKEKHYYYHIDIKTIIRKRYEQP